MLISWVSKYDARGTIAARRDFAKLGKTALSTKVTVGALAYAFQRLASNAVAAAAAEQQSLNVLNRTLSNAGFGNATTQVNDFISGMQRATGILDNELRPAFIQMFNAVGDVGASEQLLAKATNYAAGTGKNLDTVVTSLARAFTGNRESLNELNTGLDKTFLKTASLRDIITELDRKFAGEAKAALDGYAGSILSVQVAMTTASETFGKGFIDQLNLGQMDIVKFTDGIYNIGRAIGWLTDKAVGAINAISGLKEWFIDFARNTLGWSKWLQPNVIDPIGTLHDSISSLTKTSANPLQAYFDRIEKLQRKQAQEQLARQRREAAAKARQAALDKAASEKQMKYDVELANLAAAAARTQDMGTKQRLADLAAIRVETYATDLGLTTMEQILKLVNEQFGIAAGKLKELKTAQEGWTAATALTAAETSRLQALYNTLSPGSAAAFRIGETLASAGVASPSAAPTRVDGQGSWTVPSPGGNPNINVTIQGSLVAQQDLEAAIAGAVNSSARAGVAYSQIFSRL